MATPPLVIVIAGPNGAGKSTAAAHLLPAEMTFINADEVAKTLPNYPSRQADLEAGRIVLGRMDEQERLRATFAVETTLAGRTLATRIARLRTIGYRFRLAFLFVPDADLSVARVAGRVRLGGHHIPEDTIRRRHGLGIANFFRLYQPLADNWAVFDTTQMGPPQTIAEGTMSQVLRVADPHAWRLMKMRSHDE